MRKTGKQEKRFNEQILSCFHAFLMNPSGPLRLCPATAKLRPTCWSQRGKPVGAQTVAKPLFPSAVWEKACSANLQIHRIPRGSLAGRSRRFSTLEKSPPTLSPLLFASIGVHSRFPTSSLLLRLCRAGSLRFKCFWLRPRRARHSEVRCV